MNGRMTLRSFRRTAASLAINPGANVKAAQPPTSHEEGMSGAPLDAEG